MSGSILVVDDEPTLRDLFAVNLQQASHLQQESPERVSRLVTRAIAAFETVLLKLTRRGRPPRDRDADGLHVELVLGRALLAVTTAIVAQASFRGNAIRELIVGAWQRLAKKPGMTQARFCAALSLPASHSSRQSRQPRR